MKKRMLTMLLALAMVISVLPCSAFALSLSSSTACEHEFSYWATDNAYKCNKCYTVCNDHSYVYDEEKEDYACKTCGAVCEHKYEGCKCGACPATNHVPGADVKIEPATCTENGWEKVYCANCTDVYSMTEKTATGHTWENGKCTVVGCGKDCEHNYVNGNCTVCKLHKHEAGLTERVTKEATCTEAGEKTVYCAYCTEPYGTVALEATGHKAGHTKQYIVEATCTEAGYIKDCKFCLTCGEQYDVREYPLGEATGHSWVSHEIAATCTRDGMRYSACETCGAKNPFMSVILSEGHQWEEGVCTTCGAESPFETAPEQPDTDEAPECTFGQHDEMIELGCICPICKECGHTYEAGVCKYCGEKSPFSTAPEQPDADEEEDDTADNAPAQPDADEDEVCEKHSGVSNGQVVVQATCENDGYILTHMVCRNCGTAYDVTSPLGEAIGHNWKQTVTEATCTTNRKEDYVCLNCGETYDHVHTGTATGHHYVNGQCACGASDPAEEVAPPAEDNTSTNNKKYTWDFQNIFPVGGTAY